MSRNQLIEEINKWLRRFDISEEEILTAAELDRLHMEAYRRNLPETNHVSFALTGLPLTARLPHRPPARKAAPENFLLRFHAPAWIIPAGDLLPWMIHFHCPWLQNFVLDMGYTLFGNGNTSLWRRHPYCVALRSCMVPCIPAPGCDLRN